MAFAASGFGNVRDAIARPQFATKLAIPELIDAGSRNHAVGFAARAGLHQFWPGRPTPAFNYSGSYLGPVLRLRRGEDVELAIRNELDEATTVHWHGMIVPSGVDGGPHNPIQPGDTWRPRLKIDQPAGTLWYHAHPHGSTARQVYRGLAGMIIIDDGSDTRLGLPNSYGVDDLPIVLQDRAFRRDGSLAYDQSPMSTMFGMIGDTIIVNGTVSPFVKVPKGLVRLRLLNGSNARPLLLRFGDRHPFHVVASDAGLLAAPVQRKDLVVAPGERYEVLVDFAAGTSRVLESLPYDIGNGMMGMMRTASAEIEPIMRFDPDPALPVLVSSLPVKLADRRAIDSSIATRRRTIDLQPMMGGMGMMGMGRRRGGAQMGINGRAFDMDRIDFEARLGTTEIWEVRSQMMAHPFHIHGTSFHIISVNGAAPPDHLAGPKDVVLIEDTVELLVPFSAPATKSNPFMFHCHILEHEDAGMMGQFTVE